MNINVPERNGSDCKYVEISAHRGGSIGAPSIRIVFVRMTIGSPEDCWDEHEGQHFPKGKCRI
jgi:hypothetical protein